MGKSVRQDASLATDKDEKSRTPSDDDDILASDLNFGQKRYGEKVKRGGQYKEWRKVKGGG